MLNTQLPNVNILYIHNSNAQNQEIDTGTASQIIKQ
jgi:hypothetical protein